jgi:bifunctional oligoribonuclease and PAP phosphatase NrnA
MTHERIDRPEAFDAVIDRLKRAKAIAVFTHQRPDPDALGSQVAAAMVLQRNGKTVEVVNFDPPPPQYGAMQDVPGISIVNFATAQATIESTCDTLLCVDTCTYQQIEPARALFTRHPEKVVALDHHVNRDEIGQALFTDSRAAACVELIARVADRLEVPLDRPLAEVLFAGLVADTGWFRFDNVTPATLALASRLVEGGAQPSALYQRLMQNETPPKLGLMQRALASLQWHDDHRFASMVLTQRDFQETGATQSQTEYLIDLPMQVGTLEAAAVLSETPDGKVRASLRSKLWLNVSAICNGFGGGGHVRAAGCRLDGPITSAREKIVAAVTAALQARSK